MSWSSVRWSLSKEACPSAGFATRSSRGKKGGKGPASGRGGGLARGRRPLPTLGGGRGRPSLPPLSVGEDGDDAEEEEVLSSLEDLKELSDQDLAELAAELARETGKPVTAEQLKGLVRTGSFSPLDEGIEDEEEEEPEAGAGLASLLPSGAKKMMEELAMSGQPAKEQPKSEMEELLKHLPPSERRQVERLLKEEAEMESEALPSSGGAGRQSGVTVVSSSKQAGERIVFGDDFDDDDNDIGDDSDDGDDDEELFRDESSGTAGNKRWGGLARPGSSVEGMDDEERELRSDAEDSEEVLDKKVASREKRRWLQRHRIVPYSPAAKGSIVLPQYLRDKVHFVSKSLRRLDPRATAGAPLRDSLEEPSSQSTEGEGTKRSGSSAANSSSSGAPLPKRAMQRQLLRQALHERMRAAPDEAEAIVQGTKQSERPQLVYSLAEAGAYLTDHMPGSFAILTRVFAEVEELLPEFTPQSILDFGAGPCTALFAADHLWGERVVREVMAIEPSSSMTEVAQAMTKWDPRVNYRRYLSRGKESADYDMVVAAGSLNCLEDPRERRGILRSLWKNVADGGVLVVTETGSPLGFELVKEARSVILVDDLVPGRMVAPCPHAHACPMSGTGKWCHFKQRVQLLREQNKAGVVQNFQDVPYSFAVFQKLASAGASMDQPAPPGTEGPWGRLVKKPLKKGGHVTMEICSPSGKLEDVTVTKSRGKDWYTSARKVLWGDGFEMPGALAKKPRKPRTFDAELRRQTAGRAIAKRTPEEEFSKLFVDKDKAAKKYPKKPHWSDKD